MQLYIGNKNYSSWSMRPWVLMTELAIPFEEIALRLDWATDSPFKKTLFELAPTGRVPLLVDAGFAIWDTLAIVEYLAESYSDRRVWPEAKKARARARSLCAEMHAGFGALRERFPMNIEASLPKVGARCVAEFPAVTADLKRIDGMWTEQLAESGGPFLFGPFTAADAYFAPVAARLMTYAPPIGAAASAYVERVLALRSVRSWCDAARAEHDFIKEDEPYRDAAS